MARADDLSREQRKALEAVAGPEADLIRALSFIASHLTSDEGDRDDTEDEFGLDMEEVVEMAHDNMIARARHAMRAYADSLTTTSGGSDARAV